MNFTAPAFVLLFPIVLALHWMLPPSRRWVLLLAASLGFYAVGSPQALPLLRVSRWEPMRRHWASQKAKHRRPKSSG